MRLFSERLKEIRQNRKLTKKELSEKLSVEYKVISMLESDEHEPSLSMLVNIAEALDISVLYLLGITEEKLPAKFGKGNVFNIDFSSIDCEKLIKDLREYREYLEQKTE